MSSPAQRAVSEALGTTFLLATVIGSGIMAQRLSGGNDALALLCNTLPTGAILTVLILVLGPVSGAHFNPAVSLVFAMRGELSRPMAGIYLMAQLCGAVAGVWVAHLMFELPVWQFSTHVRTGPGQWLAEAVATFGLLLTIFGCVARSRTRSQVSPRQTFLHSSLRSSWAHSARCYWRAGSGPMPANELRKQLAKGADRGFPAKSSRLFRFP
jgi:glycerol uptake facilitator-like aquaporin